MTESFEIKTVNFGIDTPEPLTSAEVVRSTNRVSYLPEASYRNLPVVLAEDATEDPSINQQPLEVYLHYARRERAREAADRRPVPDAPWTVFWKRLTREGHAVTPKSAGQRERRPSPTGWQWTAGIDGLEETMTTTGGHGSRTGMVSSTSRATLPERDKHAPATLSATELRGRDEEGGFSLLTDGEKDSAYRLMRTGSWQVTYFLIATDMMGWYTAPQAYKVLGYGPAIILYTIFFLLAFGCGQILWKLYMALDSERFPVKSYPDIAERTFGRWAMYLVNLFQSAQLLLMVGAIVLLDGRVLAIIIDNKFCFLGLNIFLSFAGFLCSQPRSLRTIAIFTNLNIYLQLSIMIVTMFGVTLYDPIPSESGHTDLSEPVHLSGWMTTSESGGWIQQIGAVQIIVVAYGGATLFIEFIAEMRKPADFWKAAFGAQFTCYVTYIFFGTYVYSMQGQYSNILATINIDNVAFQAVTNILGMIAAGFTGILYAHIGAKVIYRYITRGVFLAPSLAVSRSAKYWALTTAVYWAIAWVVGSAIPNINDLNTVIGSAFVLQMSYTFPPALLLGHWIQRDAMHGDGPWVPGMAPYSNRVDSWRHGSRWRRGLAPFWYAKVALVIFFLASLSLACLGVYAGVMQAKVSYQTGVTVAFSCVAPSI